MPNVTMIPATAPVLSAQIASPFIRRRAGGYARISTDKEEQKTSYGAQVDYYTKLIKSRPDWEFVKVYTDEGISAVNTKHREGFKEMIADALDGKLDIIITKSVSRFARNTVDALSAIRKLKEKGVEVFFEKEGIYTLDSKGELLITIMSSMAQEESRNISENVAWGHRKRMADGKVSLPYGQFLGYNKGEDGLPMIVEEEAAIVRLIFTLFMEGMTPSTIARRLMKRGIPSPAGKKVWQVSTVRSILTNEKYKGDALLQKKYTEDFLTKKMKVNKGEIPQFYVESSHPYIIEPGEFDAVQAELERRSALGRPAGCGSPFSAKIVCGECGGWYGSKVWGSNTKYRKVIWRCNDKYKGDHRCKTPHVTEAEIKERFLAAWNSITANREELIADCQAAKAVLSDCKAIDAELTVLRREIEVINSLSRKTIHEIAHTAADQRVLADRNSEYLERYRVASERIAELEEVKRKRNSRACVLETFLRNIAASPRALTEFDERLWMAAIDKVTVMLDGRLVFQFKDETMFESKGEE